MIPLLIASHFVTLVQKRNGKRGALSLQAQKLPEDYLALVGLVPHLTFDAETGRELHGRALGPESLLLRAGYCETKRAVGEPQHEVVDVVSLSTVPRLELWRIHLRLLAWQ